MRARWVRPAFYTAVIACAAWGVLVEPYRLEVTRHVVHARVDGTLRIAHLSDLHTGGFGIREKRLLEALAVEQPDVILISGDTVDGGDLELARPLLSAMRAPLGVFAVSGNWEHWRPVHDAAAFHRSVGARLLINEAVRLRDDVVLVGLDDDTAGAPDAAGTLARAANLGASRHATIALFHSPVAFDDVKGHVRLALAGHTHGGQVRLPWFGALWLPPGSSRFDSGWYDEQATVMYVTRGVGTSLARIRFLCRPELTMITVVP